MGRATGSIKKMNREFVTIAGFVSFGSSLLSIINHVTNYYNIVCGYLQEESGCIFKYDKNIY
jgi:hypothetical protein